MTKPPNTNAVFAPADKFGDSTALHKPTATERAITSLVKAVGKDAKSEERAEADRRKAIGETFADWIMNQDEATQRKVFAGIEIAATKTNRKRIASYGFRPEGVDTIVEKALAEIAQAKAKAEAEQVAAEAPKPAQ